MVLRLPPHPLHRAGVLVAVAAALTLGFVAGRGYLEQRSHLEEVQRLQDGLAELRVKAEECRIAVRREEEAFAAYRTRVDSLRAEVRNFEAMDEEGVPAERYEEYLQAFDGYNEAVPVWDERADTLRARSRACRALAERHNRLADSLRNLVAPGEELGSGG